MPVTLFTDKNRQEPTKTVKSRQEAFLCIFRLKYYLVDLIHALYIQISHRIAFESPPNNEIAILHIFPTYRQEVFCDLRETLQNVSHSEITRTLIVIKHLPKTCVFWGKKYNKNIISLNFELFLYYTYITFLVVLGRSWCLKHFLPVVR